MRDDGDIDRFKRVCGDLIDVNGVGRALRCRFISYEIDRAHAEAVLQRLQLPPPGTRCPWCSRAVPWQLEEPTAPCSDDDDELDERHFVDSLDTMLTVDDVAWMLDNGEPTPFGGGVRHEGP